MLLSDIISRVADDANLNTPAIVPTVLSRLTRTVNRVCAEIWDGFRWSFKWRNYRIVTDVDYITGTTSATNGSYSVIGSGTAFLPSMVGWHINFLQDSPIVWYKVRAYTSATQLELDVPYQGFSGSNKSYVIRHFDYLLPTEVWDLASVMVTDNDRPLTILEPTSLDILAPVPYVNGYPIACSIYGSDSMAPGGPTQYSTGTISGTISTNVLTGSGTMWLGNIFPGDLVNAISNQYTVASVDSNTQITVYQQLTANVSSSVYTITRQFGRFMRIMWPSAYNYTIDIRAMRIYQPMVNLNDTNELFYRMPNAVVLKAAAIELMAQGDRTWPQMAAQAEQAVMKARAEDDSLTTRDQISPMFSYRMGARRNYRRTFR